MPFLYLSNNRKVRSLPINCSRLGLSPELLLLLFSVPCWHMDVPPRDGERVSQKRETFLIPSFYTPLLERSFHIISQWPLLLLMEDRLHITQGTHHSSSSVSKLFLCCDSPRRLRLPDCIVPPSLSIVCKNLMKNTPTDVAFSLSFSHSGCSRLFLGEEMAVGQYIYRLHFVPYGFCMHGLH